MTELSRGVAPCLNCAEQADPDAIHIVYEIHFSGLRLYKVGITNTEVRNDRIASHVAQGGVLIEACEVPNREAARTVEEAILCSARDFPSDCTSRDFPQGGYTETWSDQGPAIGIGEIVEQCTQEEAPGFDRLRRLREYFDKEPATIEELLEFRHVESKEVDGFRVHHVGFSEPVEQVLRKIRARRESSSIET
ncbi:hypothetical protein ACH4TQ_06535 [Streptomyces sp. NPDC021218]|uniref:hypothetical protein n=1 Tax=Streptomyces sp. NPDC021218 TaxID=3365119 RepID=UPI0037928591